MQQRNYSYREYSYQQLDEMTSLLAVGLQSQGIGKGTRTVVMVRPGMDFFAIVFALFRINAVLVAVDPGMGIRNLKQCLAEARPEAFIGNRKAHLARILLGWAKSSINQCISTEKVFLPGIIPLEKLSSGTVTSDIPTINRTHVQETAAILFTSGSTGPPKGVVYTHANFLAQVKALQSLYNIR
ncbi:MAG: AMP-binding protein, partial [Gammaproteobacteria bacterium]